MVRNGPAYSKAENRALQESGLLTTTDILRIKQSAVQNECSDDTLEDRGP